MTAARQQTIAAPAELEGVGLHTGAAVRLRLLPAPVNRGVVFQRTDAEGGAELPALVAHVVETDRGTTLGVGACRVHTVEHLLSALAAHQVDNVVIEIDGAEVPALDGSARPFVEMIARAGLQEQDAPARLLRLDAPLTVAERRSSYVVTPADDYTVAATIEFEHPLIGRQFASHRIEPAAYDREIAAARTFGFLHEAEALRSRGRALGSTLANAVVLTDDGLHDGVQLRFPDEFVRHKLLDIVGDLALVGARICGHVVAERSSHRGNVALARELAACAERKALARPILDVQQIMQYLPHRYPFLLVDRIVEYEEGRRIVGLKNVTINEPFFQGHFPGRPTMPGVLIIEAMAQVGGMLMMDSIENPEEKIVYFMTLDNVKWRRPVTPGDQIRFELTVLQIRGRTCRMRGVGTVDGSVVAEAEMMARVVDR